MDTALLKRTWTARSVHLAETIGGKLCQLAQQLAVNSSIQGCKGVIQREFFDPANRFVHTSLYIFGTERTQPVSSVQPQQTSNTFWWVASQV